MKKLFKYALFAGVAVVALAASWQGLLFYKGHKKSHARHKSIPVKEEKPFVIIIPSFNNSAFCEKNLRSVLDQKYTNFRIIYIDDCSTDDTYAKVKALVTKSNLAPRVTLIHNEKNCGALANFYRSIHTCQNHEIIVVLDGDDFLAHDEVLAKLNRAYADPDVWMTYGNYLDYPTYKQEVVTPKKIPEAVIKHNTFRKAPWTSSHLRTFYAGLFKKIKLEDLHFEGRFYPMAGDLAVMYPLLEMSGKHARFISDILYLYNRTNPLSDHKTNFPLQQACADKIRKDKPYAPLKELFSEK